jgi:hypothetical protein
VDVWHLEARDHQADARGVEHLPLRVADCVRDAHEVRDRIGIEVGPLVDLVDRHHERVTRRQRAHVEEGDSSIVPPQEAARDLAGDDAGEDGRHGARDYGAVAAGGDSRVDHANRVAGRAIPGSPDPDDPIA